MKKIAMKCPLCPRLLESQKSALSHIARRHWLPVDLLPCKFKTRRRGSNEKAFLTAIKAAPAVADPHLDARLPMPPPPTQPQGRELVVVVAPPLPPPPPMDLVMYDENVAMRLPLKKRMALILQMSHQHQLYICHKCGQSYMKPSALGGHKAQHTLADKKKEREVEQEMEAANAEQGKPEEPLVVQQPRRNNGSYQCQGCERKFDTGQGLGGHKYHCKGHTTLGTVVN